jgi:hypothetical protein
MSFPFNVTDDAFRVEDWVGATARTLPYFIWNTAVKNAIQYVIKNFDGVIGLFGFVNTIPFRVSNFTIQEVKICF